MSRARSHETSVTALPDGFVLFGLPIIAAISAMLLLLAAVLLSATGGRPRHQGWASANHPIDVTVAELVARYTDFDGRAVRVDGRLARCEPDGCYLEQRGNSGALVSIADNAAFDRLVARRVGEEIMVTGFFDGDCYRPNVLCLDRAPSLTVDPVPAVRFREDY